MKSSGISSPSRYLFIMVGVLLMTLVPGAAVLAQEGGPTDDEVNEIAEELYCPVCENIPLDVCGTQACVQWRGLIREKLEQGWTEAEIKNYFVDQYGDRVLPTPPARGLNWLVYILPPVALLAAAGVLFRTVRNWTRPDQTGAAVDDPPPQPDDPYAARLEEELSARQGSPGRSSRSAGDEVQDG